jgi:hypothetical protein
MVRRLVTTVLLVVLTAAVPVTAQQPISETDAWRALAEALEPGAFVAVRTKDGKRVKGTLVQHVSDGIVLKPKTRIPVPARQLLFSDIDSIERQKQGMSPGMKVVLGVGIGAGAVLLAAAIAFATAFD